MMHFLDEVLCEAGSVLSHGHSADWTDIFMIRKIIQLGFAPLTHEMLVRAGVDRAFPRGTC